MTATLFLSVPGLHAAPSTRRVAFTAAALAVVLPVGFLLAAFLTGRWLHGRRPPDA